MKIFRHQDGEADQDEIVVVSTADLPKQSIFGLNLTYAQPRTKQKASDGDLIQLTWRERLAMLRAAFAVILPVVVLLAAMLSFLMFGLIYLWGGFN